MLGQQGIAPAGDSYMLKSAIAALLFGSMLVQPAAAQNSIGQRAAELEEISSQLNDPDPMMRLAAMEEILASGDRLKISVATSIAIQGDDRMLRGLAMLGFLVNQKQVDFKIRYPGKMEDAYAKASVDPDSLQKFFQATSRSYDRIPEFVHNAGRIAPIYFKLDGDLFGGVAYYLGGTAKGDEGSEGTLRVNGDRINLHFPRVVMGPTYVDNCKMEILPSEKGVIAGELACGAISYPISAEIR